MAVIVKPIKVTVVRAKREDKIDSRVSVEYHPFMRIPEIYKNLNSSLAFQRVLHAMENCLGTPVASISTEFKELLREVFLEEYPNLCCSPARAILSGWIKGVPAAVKAQPSSQWKHQTSQALLVLDLFETLAYRNLPKKKVKKGNTK